jgi:folate-binding Fe-S cluster repair protein YgfZ
MPTGALRLADWGLIRARGADAASFLHSQLTQDIEHLAPGQARLAGYCSPKGRLLASFVTWREGPDEVLLACSADLLPATLKRLSMFVLRAKCKLDDAAADWALYGLAGSGARDWLGADAPAGVWQLAPRGAARVLRLPDAEGQPRYLLAQAPAEPAPALPAVAPEAWAWLEARSGVARIVGPTVEQFVPQMVNLELVGGVNFQKGCYPEIGRAHV